MSNFKDLSKNILSKILFGFLVLSFVLFGISSFLLQGSDSWVAKIDGRKISYQQLEQALNFEKQILLKRNPNNDQVLQYANSGSFKIDVLGKMINESLIETLGNRYGIYPDRTQILINITQNPNFHKNGKFDHKFFKTLLQNNGIDEESYIQIIKNETINTMVLNSLTLVSPIDQDITTKLANKYEETRYADLITISQRNIGQIKYPKNDDLQSLYEENKANFQEPQKRDVQYLSFDKSALTRGVYISNKQALEFYNTNKEKFKMPQTRDFYHIVFNDRVDAEKFHEKLLQTTNRSKSFIEIGKALAGKSEKQLLIKGITIDDSIPEVADKVFSLKLGQNSEIFESDLGYHIILVDKINDGEYLAFQKARAEIKKQLQEKLVQETMEKKIAQINESLLAGNSLHKTAKEFNLGRVASIKNFAFNQEKSESYYVKKARELEQFSDNAFKIEPLKTSTLIEGSDKFYAIFVSKVTQPRLKTFSEVKSELVKSYYEKNKEEKLTALTKKVSEEINQSPEKARQIARKYGLKIQRKSFAKTKKIKIQGKEYETSSAFLEDLFNVKIDKATNYHKSETGKEYEIAVLKSIKTPKLSLADLNKHRSKLSDSYRQGFLQNFNKYIEKEHNLIINEKFIKSIQGESANR